MLERVLEEGRRAWPQLQVSPAELEAFLSTRAPAEPPPAADLFLVCACLNGATAALSALETTVLSKVPSWVSSIDPAADFAHDVGQAVREQLLVRTPKGLASYAGKGSLEGWVRVSTVRLALKLKERRPQVASGSGPLDRGSGDLEGDLAKAQAREQVEAALEAVLSGLDNEERAWLKLYYLDGCTLEQIARLFKVHVSTISRRMAALEGQVLHTLRARLEQRLRLPPSEVDSLIRFVRSQLEVSLSRALKKTTD